MLIRNLALALTVILLLTASDSPQRHDLSGYTIQIDLWPDESSHSARYDVVATFHGPDASAALSSLHGPDSVSVQQSIDGLLQFGLYGKAQRERVTWQPSADTTMVTLSGTYRDSAWTGDAIEFSLETKVAPLDMPPSRVVKDKDDVAKTHALVNTAILRFHHTLHWEPDPDVVGVVIRGLTYDGSFRATERLVATDKWLEIRQRFEMRPAKLSPGQYAHLYRDYLRYRTAVRQIYRYRKRIEPLMAQAKRSPGVASTLDAAARILGPDGGGSGPLGTARRSAARTLLGSLVRSPAAGARPYVLLARAAKAEGHYRSADSLVSLARAANQNDLEALRLQIDLRSELWDRTGELAAWREWKDLGGTSDLMPTFIGTLYQNGLDSEAAATQGAFLSANPSEARAMDEMLVQGFVSGFRCREARAAFSKLEPDATLHRQRVEMILCRTCGPLDRIIEIMEPLMEEGPADAVLAEYLAWAYVRLGRHLDHAADVIDIASMLEPRNRDVRITEGVLALRTGKVASARKILSSALAIDDRPGTQVAAGYFLGLCSWADGDLSKARKRWRELLPVRNEEWNAIVTETLGRADEGRPESVLFSNPDSSSHSTH